MRRAELFTLSSLLYILSLHLGGRAFGPPLCRGCAPATPPSKTIAHRPCVLIPAVPLHQRGCRQPNTQSDSLNGGRDKVLVKTGTVYGLVVTSRLRIPRPRGQVLLDLSHGKPSIVERLRRISQLSQYRCHLAAMLRGMIKYVPQHVIHLQLIFDASSVPVSESSV